MNFYFVYRWVAWPLLRVIFEVLGRFNSKIARGLELRRSVDRRSPWVKLLPPAPPTVWIHCASGEFEYAKPVITILKKRAPRVKVVVTFFSPTYADNIRKFAGVDWVVPLPWDTPQALSEFLGSYRPFALMVARTDVWPEMARQAHLRGLASTLFSATLTPSSGRTRGLGRWATCATLDQLDEIFCVTEADLDAFQSLGLSHAHVSVAGDTRYDQVVARLSAPKPVKEFSGDLFVCGSTWPEDEAVLIPAIRSAGVCAVLVPHEPTASHVEALSAAVLAAGLTPVLYSDPDASEKMRAPLACLIVDQVGLLAELYLQARWAFVGGSFKKTVHSVMEPLAAGCVTFVGPLHTNNREAVAFQALHAPGSALSFVSVVQDAESLARKLLEPAPSRGAVREAVLARTGCSARLVDWLLERLGD